MKKIICKIIERFFHDDYMDYLAAQHDDAQKQEALKAGYSEKDWQEYWIDKQNRPLREAYDAGAEQGYMKGFSNTKRGLT